MGWLNKQLTRSGREQINDALRMLDQTLILLNDGRDACAAEMSENNGEIQRLNEENSSLSRQIQRAEVIIQKVGELLK